VGPNRAIYIALSPVQAYLRLTDSLAIESTGYHGLPRVFGMIPIVTSAESVRLRSSSLETACGGE
jgi:hypothetical protein